MCIISRHEATDRIEWVTGVMTKQIVEMTVVITEMTDEMTAEMTAEIEDDRWPMAS